MRELSFVQIAQTLLTISGQDLCILEKSVQKNNHQGKRGENWMIIRSYCVLEQPHLYISEMRQHILDTTEVDTLNATICRILGKHRLTRQKMRLQRCTELRVKFRAEMCFFFNR